MVGQQANVPRPFKVTIIYMVEERTKKRIDDLYEQLKACGIVVFMFSKDMPAKESHEVEMQKQIEDADSVIICYSENFRKGKGYRHKEVLIAINEQKKTPRGNSYLITIRLDECELPGDLKDSRTLDYFRRDHFDGIMRWGLKVRRDELVKEGEKIQKFNYPFSQQDLPIEETILPNDAPFTTNPVDPSEIQNVFHTYDSPNKFHSCFISSSSHDQDIAKQLHADLQSKGVQCWFAPQHMKTGDKIRSRIDKSIYDYDKFLLILSKDSLASPWVETEVEAACERERQQNKSVLFPIRLDETVMQTTQSWAAEIRRTRHISDFTGWKDPASYKQAFTRLLHDLEIEGEDAQTSIKKKIL